MTLTRVACWKNSAQGPAVAIEIDGIEFAILHANLPNNNVESKLNQTINQMASVAGKELPELFFHQNRDGSIAIATGFAPEIWPEDKTE
jgi:hypothetical protein